MFIFRLCELSVSCLLFLQHTLLVNVHFRPSMHQKLSATIMHQEKLNALMVLNGHRDLTHAWIHVTLQINIRSQYLSFLIF